ncbi:hypothetical protein [Streptomyces antibioticus]|uniref:Uncharacterized protein n=1 Tax=Streptomyces antibioticus TaxID=1890 RepID=A0AAE7CJH5_STRAT|nr:hypothetical protein [Streptomyces antibioticus]OOQ54172.1 hypothetical protein AFM16_06275 [Streptomyces antibioticus]QIT43189.1 hypothetical protein HCX60_06400 [Streptomyces antibioticus]
MISVALACVVPPVTALLYGSSGLRHRRETRWRRAVAERCAAALSDDPYAGADDRWWPEDDVQAAAARLVLDGLVTVNHRGNLSLTAAGADPARTAGHPLPDALLTALRRRTASAALGNLLAHDTAFRAARADFHTAVRDRLAAGRPRPPRPAGCLTVIGVLLLVLEMTFTTVALLDGRPRGAVDWTASVVVGAALLGQFHWLGLSERREAAATRLGDPVAAHLRQAGVHPALTELAARAPESAALLRTSRTRLRRRRNRGRRRGRVL